MDQEKGCKSQMVDWWLKQIEALRKRNVEERGSDGQREKKLWKERRKG